MDASATNRQLLIQHARGAGVSARNAVRMAGGNSFSVSPFPSALNLPIRTSSADFPLNAKRELRPWDRRELVRKMRYLRNSCGLVRACIEKPVQLGLPGGLTPSSATGDPDFDLAADRYFDRWAMQPVDVTGQYNFYESIEMIATEFPVDGDHFVLKVRDPQSHRCQLQFFQSDQVGQYAVPASDPQNSYPFWWDGIARNAFGKPISFRLLQQPIVTGYLRAKDYSAEDVIHIYDPNRFQLGRGIPWGYHGANSIIDTLDMRALDMVSRKLNLALAAVLKKTGARPGSFGPPLDTQVIFGNSPTNENNFGSSEMETGKPPTPGQPTGQITWEQILGGGAIPVLEDDREIQFLDTDRPPISWINAAEFVFRDFCAGWGLNYETVWNMAAMGGPGARWILEDLNAFLNRIIRILSGRYCQPVRSWVLANGIINGELPECKTDTWWECAWNGSQKVTIDRGRDGKLFVQLKDNGMLILNEWWAMLGKDGRKMRRARIDEIAEDMAYCQTKNVPYEFYMEPAQGSGIGAPTPANDESEPFTPDQEARLQEILAAAQSSAATGAEGES